MTPTDTGFILDSGREIQAGGELTLYGNELCYGYDDRVYMKGSKSADLTLSERFEIARYMISLWAKWGGLPFEVS